MISNGLDKTLMKSFTAVGLAAALSLGAGTAYAQSHKLDISQDQMRLAERGWSVKKNIMGKAVYNDNNDKIGEVEDLIFSRNVRFSVLSFRWLATRSSSSLSSSMLNGLVT